MNLHPDGVSVPWGTIYTTALYSAAAAPRIAVAAIAWWRHLNRNQFRPIT